MVDSTILLLLYLFRPTGTWFVIAGLEFVIFVSSSVGTVVNNFQREMFIRAKEENSGV